MLSMQNSDKFQASISYHFPQPQFSTLPSGIMLHSMQLPVFQELKAVSTVHQFNNQYIPIPISAYVQTLKKSKKVLIQKILSKYHLS